VLVLYSTDAAAMKTYEVRYKLKPSGRYLFKRVQAIHQLEANSVFDCDMPNAIRCGSAKVV